MKKVLVLVAATLLLAAPAFAGILGSNHDLTVTGSTFGSSYNEVCVYCHTPHGAGSVGPLWNRNTSGVTITTFYNSTVSGTFQANSTAAKIAKTDVKLCLSCHDGASMNVALLNPPNSGGNPISDNITSEANLELDLSNDHPIGFNYNSTLVDADGELEEYAIVNATSVQFFQSAGESTADSMWCSSCHDVHNPEKGTPFLVTTNVSSGLCLTCHLK